MRYALRYDVGPMYMGGGPFGRRRTGGPLAGILHALLSVVAFLAQLIVWLVLVAVGIVYTVVWALISLVELLIPGRRRHPV